MVAGSYKTMGLDEVFKKIKICFWDKYADFNGRAGRKEYWCFAVFLIFCNMILTGLLRTRIAPVVGFVSFVSIVLIIPHVAVVVRRFHDTSRSGWELLLYNVLFFICMILIITARNREDDLRLENLLFVIVILIRCVYILLSKSQPEENKYGQPPK